MLPVTSSHVAADGVASALAGEAARNEEAADRYEALGDDANARVCRQLAVALRAAGDAYERRTARRRTMRSQAGAIVDLPDRPSAASATLPPPPRSDFAVVAVPSSATGPSAAPPSALPSAYPASNISLSAGTA